MRDIINILTQHDFIVIVDIQYVQNTFIMFIPLF